MRKCFIERFCFCTKVVGIVTRVYSKQELFETCCSNLAHLISDIIFSNGKLNMVNIIVTVYVPLYKMAHLARQLNYGLQCT